MDTKKHPFTSDQKINQSHVFDQTSKQTTFQYKSQDQTIQPRTDHYIYSRVVQIQVKGKRAKENAILPYQASFNGYLSFRDQNFYVLTCIHPLIHYGNNLEERVELTQIHFQSLNYKGELYCLDESRRLFEIYNSRIKSYEQAKKKQDEVFSEKAIGLKDYTRIVGKVVEEDWVLLIIKWIEIKNELSECERERQRSKNQELTHLIVGGYQQDLQMVAWEKSSLLSIQSNKYKTQLLKSLKFKTTNKMSKQIFNYFTKPRIFMHGLVTRSGDSGAPIFQDVQGKIRWVGMNSGVFCQQGIGLHFNKDLKQIMNNLLIILIKQKDNVAKQRVQIEHIPFAKTRLVANEFQLQSFVVQIEVQASRKETEYTKFSNGLLLNQKYVLCFLHNIYQKTDVKFQELSVQVSFRRNSNKFSLLLPNLKLKTMAYQIKRDNYLGLAAQKANKKFLNQALLELSQVDLLILQIGQPKPQIKTLLIQDCEALIEQMELLIKAYTHEIVKTERQLSISHFNIKLQEKQVVLVRTVENVYQITNFQQQRACFKSGGALISNWQKNKPKLLGLYFGLINKVSYAIIFNKKLVNKIKDQLISIQNKRSQQQQKQEEHQKNSCYLQIPRLQCYDNKSRDKVLKLRKNHFELSLKKDQEHLFYYKLSAFQCSAKQLRIFINIITKQIQDIQRLSLAIAKQMSTKNELIVVNCRTKVGIVCPRQKDRVIRYEGGNQKFGIEIKLESKVAPELADRRWFMHIVYVCQQNQSFQNTKSCKLDEHFLQGHQNFLFISLKTNKEMIAQLEFEKLDELETSE